MYVKHFSKDFLVYLFLRTEQTHEKERIIYTQGLGKLACLSKPTYGGWKEIELEFKDLRIFLWMAGLLIFLSA